MIREEHFRFTSSEGKIRCHGIRWIPDGEIKAVLQLVHGMSEYIARYGEFARYMAQQGFLVVGHDHIGHGESVLSEEDYGYFTRDNGNFVLVEDIYKVTVNTKKTVGDIPYYMLGHSMGSFLTRQYICLHGKELDGVILCGTGYQPQAVTLFGRGICKILAMVKGWHAKSLLLDAMVFGSNDKKFKKLPDDPGWLCSRKEVVQKYADDPRCGFSFTINGYYNLFLNLSRIIRKDYLERMPKDLPVLFIAGEEDPVGNYGKGVKKTEQIFRNNGMKDVTCILYPKDRHEILNEYDRENVYKDVYDWISGL